MSGYGGGVPAVALLKPSTGDEKPLQHELVEGGFAELVVQVAGSGTMTRPDRSELTSGSSASPPTPATGPSTPESVAPPVAKVRVDAEVAALAHASVAANPTEGPP